MAKNFQIFEQNDAQSAAAEAGEHLNLLLMENLKRPVLLMLSAGSALAVVDYVGQTALGENLTVSMLDERFSQDPGVNNFAQMQKTDFYQLAFDAGCSFFGTLPRNGETINDLAARWEKNLHAWRSENPDGLIIATLGMGVDGHTAGIFPEADDKKFDQLFKAAPWVLAYDVGEKNQFRQRLTTTLTFFAQIDIGLGYIAGEKKQRFVALLEGVGKINELPALGWQAIKRVEIFTDIK